MAERPVGGLGLQLGRTGAGGEMVAAGIELPYLCDLL